MADKDFIKENIVGRKQSWRKRARHYVRVIVSALLFGVVSAGTLAISEPWISARIHPTEPETVDLEPETTAPVETTAVPQEAETTAKETEPIEEVVRSEIETYPFSVNAVSAMVSSLKQVATEAEKSIVEVTSSVSQKDFLGQDIKAENSRAGVIIAMTGDEILIMCPGQDLKEQNTVEVTCLRESVYSGQVKALDHTDNIAIISIPLSSVSEKDRTELTGIRLGSSHLLQKGDLVISVGAPAGELYSMTYGNVSSINYNYPYIDGTLGEILADLDSDGTMGTFVLNTSGELVGWVSGNFDKSPEHYCHIAGISDFLGTVESLINGTPVPYLGLDVQQITAEMQQQGIPAGLYIQEARTDSPAYAAGIQSGDILVRVGDREIGSALDLSTALKGLKVGDTVTLSVLRQKGTEYTEVAFPLTVAAR